MTELREVLREVDPFDYRETYGGVFVARCRFCQYETRGAHKYNHADDCKYVAALADKEGELMGLMHELNDDFEDFVDNVISHLGVTPMTDITLAEMVDMDEVYGQALELQDKYFGPKADDS